jgi:DNA topoisomerase-1
MLVYTDTEEDENKKKSALYSLEEGDTLNFINFEEKQHFTQPPAHFTEASLVHTLEELGIGRPSTYAPTIATLLKRHYVTKEGKSIFMTELGSTVNKIMVEYFPSIVNEKFTANMESLLDGVEEGTVDWKSIVRNFYPDLDESVKKAEKALEKITIADEVSDVICENCGRRMVIKYGPHGRFLACPGFPECKNTKPYLEKIGVKCPKCGDDIVIRKTGKGRVFYGCMNYPKCDFTSWQRPVDMKCPKCGKYMVIRGSRYVCSDNECGYYIDKKDVKKEQE